MGGMRALEWAVSYPDRVDRCLALATCAFFTADQIAWGTPQLAAIRADRDFAGGDYYDGSAAVGRHGASPGRSRTPPTGRRWRLDTRFGRSAQADEDPLAGGRFAVQSYLQHHGRKLGARFDPNSYLVLTEAMNSHDIGRGRGGVDAALQRISAELTVAVVDSDRLFLPAQGELIATAPTARPLIVMHSDYGHDGFLIEADAIAEVVRDALHGLNCQWSGGRHTGRSVCELVADTRAAKVAVLGTDGAEVADVSLAVEWWHLPGPLGLGDDPRA